jgi:SAM-dependent methyltransferase
MSHHHADHHDHHDRAAAAGLTDILDLDAEVLADVSHAVHAEIERLADSPVRTILDLGAGTGTGTIGLLGHFTDAHVTAVDASADMLGHLGRRTHDLGLSPSRRSSRSTSRGRRPRCTISPIPIAPSRGWSR